MTTPTAPLPGRLLRPAIALTATDNDCLVTGNGRVRVVPFAAPFPRPRVERVTPGHLVAVVRSPGMGEQIVWRWFDAVVLDQDGATVTLWEPLHGTVAAQSRHPDRSYPRGSRAYASAGLPGAEWWVAGPAVDVAEDADVELDEVDMFFAGHGLWDTIS